MASNNHRKKSKPSFDENFEAAKQKVREQDWQNKYAPNIGQGRKNHSAEL